MITQFYSLFSIHSYHVETFLKFKSIWQVLFLMMCSPIQPRERIESQIALPCRILSQTQICLVQCAKTKVQLTKCKLRVAKLTLNRPRAPVDPPNTTFMYLGQVLNWSIKLNSLLAFNEVNLHKKSRQNRILIDPGSILMKKIMDRSIVPLAWLKTGSKARCNQPAPSIKKT